MRPFRLLLAVAVIAAMGMTLTDTKADGPSARFSAEREAQLELAGFRRADDYSISGAWVRSVGPGGRPALNMGGGSSAAPSRQPSPIPSIVPPSGDLPTADRADFMGGHSTPGATGPAGPAGPKGDKGDPGADGKTPSEAELARIISAVVIQLKGELKGDPGERGPAGPAGAPGRDGRDAVVDEATVSDLIARLPPITVRTVNDAGQVVDEVKVHLGGDLNLHHNFKRN